MISPQGRSCRPALPAKHRFPASLVRALFVLAYTPLPDALSDPDQAKDTPDISLRESWASGFPLPTGEEPMEILLRIHAWDAKSMAMTTVVTDLVLFRVAPAVSHHAKLVARTDWLLNGGEVDELRSAVLGATGGADVGMIGKRISFDPDFTYSLGGPLTSASLAMDQDMMGHLVAPDDAPAGKHLHPGAPHAATFIDAEDPRRRGLVAMRMADDEDRRYPFKVREDLQDPAGIAAIHPCSVVGR